MENYKDAMNEGCVEAANDFAQLFLEVSSRQRQPPEREKALQVAAEMGSVEAQCKIGIETKNLDLLKKVADQGHAEGQYHYASEIYENRGQRLGQTLKKIPKDLQVCLKYFKLSGDQGIKEAYKMMKAIYSMNMSDSKSRRLGE